MSLFSIPIVATTFKVVGAVIAAPSASVLLLYAINEIRRLFSPPKSETNFGDNPDAILMMLKGVTKSINALARLAGSLGQLLLSGLAVISVATLVLGAACWFTGRGLQVQANWARVSAFVLILLAMLPSLLLALSIHNLGRVVMFAIVIIFAFGLHTVWTGYTPQTL